MNSTEVETQLKIMVEPYPHQAEIDKLTTLVLLGKINCYQAKEATEDEDWERARQLIEEAK